MNLRLLTLSVFACALSLSAQKTLDIYSIDVEGGQATLFVTPSGESMLVDTGWGGFNNRDADRIADVAQKAGVKQIDYLLITHYHEDHVGGVPQLAAKLPIKTFVDHGPSVEHGAKPDEMYGEYSKLRDAGKHLLVHPGDDVPVKGIHVKILTAAGDVLSSALPGAGEVNTECKDFVAKRQDPSENARSVGSLITYGKFRMIDLGDLTWNKEHDLVCPTNKIGTVDVYLTTHHGMNISGPPAILHALRPRVAVMNNGATKGGTPEAWQTIHNTPGLQDIWQIHYSVPGGAANNADEKFIANPSENPDSGNWLKISAKPDGSFTVTNGRTGFSKTYPAGS